ncbi:hypothetical protein NQ317_012374 [Molorchus minor]|uniref:Uncharacterized protein n=1 Tax=Molorchus minor TaxID=1323400 RepID=A0ABQ9JQV9_9CUCU|nr:hypothetical protein NQ317_012374 [Molorchus minor]
MTFVLPKTMIPRVINNIPKLVEIGESTSYIVYKMSILLPIMVSQHFRVRRDLWSLSQFGAKTVVTSSFLGDLGKVVAVKMENIVAIRTIAVILETNNYSILSTKTETILKI